MIHIGRWIADEDLAGEPNIFDEEGHSLLFDEEKYTWRERMAHAELAAGAVNLIVQCARGEIDTAEVLEKAKEILGEAKRWRRLNVCMAVTKYSP